MALCLQEGFLTFLYPRCMARYMTPVKASKRVKQVRWHSMAATATSIPPPERTYHKTQAAYALPNDNVEHKRLETQHALLRDLMGGRTMHAPVPDHITKAVDVGCGTGAVTHSIASARPSAKVLGVDLSPVPEHLRTRLPNLSYVQGDIRALYENGADPRFARNSFDYIFSRLLIMGITDWDAYVNHAVSLTKPGGWVEMQESDYHWHRVPSGTAASALQPEVFAPHDLNFKDLLSYSSHQSEDFRYTPLWAHTMTSLLRSKSLDPYAGSGLPSRMAAAGLTDIHIRRYISPLGTWPGLSAEAAAFGRYVGMHTQLVYPLLLQKLGRETGKNAAEVEEAVEDLQSAFEGEGEAKRMWHWVYVVWGRKPTE